MTKSTTHVEKDTSTTSSDKGGIISDMVSRKEHQAEMLLEVAKKWGLFAAISVFFISVGYVQFNKLDARVAEGEKYVRETLATIVTSNTLALHDVAQQHDILIRSLDENTQELKKINESKAIQPVLQPVLLPATTAK